MKRSSMMTLALGALLTVAGCEQKSEGDGAQMTVAAPTPPAAAPAAPPLADEDIPTEMDFEEEAARRITAETNLEAELDGLEREIGAAP